MTRWTVPAWHSWRKSSAKTHVVPSVKWSKKERLRNVRPIQAAIGSQQPWQRHGGCLMSGDDLLYEDGHWCIRQCPASTDRIHIINVHTSAPFPLCWSVPAAQSLVSAIIAGINTGNHDVR